MSSSTSTALAVQPQVEQRPASLREQFVIALKVQNLAERTIKAYIEAMLGFVRFLGGDNRIPRRRQIAPRQSVK